jgi:VCBS repeat-containing protein
MQSEYIFSAESEGSVFDHDDAEAATQVAAAPQDGEALDTPLLPHDAAQVVVTPGQSVVRVPVEPGEVIELPFGPDAHFVARLGDGNLAIRVGEVTVILQGYQADGENPPVIQAADGTPIDIATILAETDPNIDIQTAAGPGTNAGGQGADNTGALFQQLGGEGGLGGFQGIGSQDDTSNPDGGPGADGGSLLRSLAPTNTAPTVSDFDVKTDEDTALAGQLTGTDPDGDPLTYHTTGTVPAGLTVNSDGTWSFDPTGLYDYLAAGDKTSISFQYQANDGKADSNIATANIEIDGLNDKASIKGDLDGAVKEETQETATGTVTVTDADHDQSFAFATSGSSPFGTWEVQADGTWTYHLDSGNATVNALPEGDKLTDTFTVTSLDGSDSQVVTVTITGTNDVPTITGQSTGDVTEDSFFHFATAGKLTVTDPDSGESHMDADAGVSTYGAWVVGKDGTWGYVLNELDPAVHALQAGETATDTFTVTSEDGSQTQDVTITIHGVNDRAIITGDKSGKVTEDSGATVTGTLDVFDLDHDQSHAQVQTDVASKYGTWSVDADGHWSYKLDDTDPDVNALGAGGKLTDTFTVTSLDGTDTQTVKITINGHNDAPVIGGTSVTSGSVTEAGDLPQIDEAGLGGGLEPSAWLSAQIAGDSTVSDALTDILTNPVGVIAAVTQVQGLGVDEGTAIAAVWDYLDDVYVSAGPNQSNVNEAFTLLGLVYANYLQNGGMPLVDVTAKYTADGADAGSDPDREQSLHDNLLGNLTSAALQQRYAGDPALQAALTALITNFDSPLLTRPYADGSEANGAASAAAHQWDADHGYVSTATGTLVATDVDHGAVLTWSANATAGSYGSFAVDAATGEWTYKLDNGLPATQALAEGETGTETFTATVTDEHGATDTVTVTVSVTGTNDAPVITGDDTGAVTEDVSSTVTGKLDVADLDHDQSHTQDATNVASDNGYGTWSVDADGNWSYTLDNTNTTVNALPAGGKLTDTFTVTSLDGTGTETVTITITGTNDVPTITGQLTGDVYEDGPWTATGHVTVNDPDIFQGLTLPSAGIGGPALLWYVDVAGNWLYTLNPAVQGLHSGETTTDTFTVTSVDLTQTQDITITIHGRDDQAYILGDTKGTVTEDSIAAATGTLQVLDADNGDSHTEVATNAAASYGTWSVDANGHWSYVLDNSKADVNGLGVNDTLTDSFTVKSLDGSAGQVVTITIKGANDAPVIDSNGAGAAAGISIAENTTAVTNVHAADVDKSDTVTYGISGGADAGLFSIDQATGALSFKAAPDFEHPLDSDGNNVYDVTVKADDGHGGIDTQAIAVTVTDVAEATPTQGADDYIFTTESGLFTVSDSWLLANDTGNPHSALQIDNVDAGANAGYFDPFLVFFPTPFESNGNVSLDLDTNWDLSDIFNNSYLKSGDHTTFDYTATDGAGSAAATVDVTYVNSNTIDRSGDTHDDIIVGSSGNEQLTGGTGNDFIDGAGGDDRIFGGTGIDSLYGGAGDDVIRYSPGDSAHGGDDSVNIHRDLSGQDADRGDVLAFGESVNLTDAKYAGQFDGIETISLKNGEGGGSGAQSLTIDADNVLAMSDHTVRPGGVFAEHAAIRIDMNAVDELYLSISKDGGQWSNSGKSADGNYDIFVHDTTAGTAGNSEDAYVLVAHANVANVHLNQDQP